MASNAQIHRLDSHALITPYGNAVLPLCCGPTARPLSPPPRITYPLGAVTLFGSENSQLPELRTISQNKMQRINKLGFTVLVLFLFGRGRMGKSVAHNYAPRGGFKIQRPFLLSSKLYSKRVQCPFIVFYKHSKLCTAPTSIYLFYNIHGMPRYSPVYPPILHSHEIRSQLGSVKLACAWVSTNRPWIRHSHTQAVDTIGMFTALAFSTMETSRSLSVSR